MMRVCWCYRSRGRSILPELVKGEEGDKSVNYSGLIGVLIEAVKELSARVEELENR